MIKTIIIYLAALFFISQSTQAAESKSSSNTKYQNGWTFGGSVIYPFASRKFEFNGKRSTTGENIKATFEFEAKPSIYLFVKRSKENSFGFTFGYEMIPKSQLTGGSVKIGSSAEANPVTYNDLNNFSTEVIHIGSEYRLERLYFPIEWLLINVPKYDVKPSSLGIGQGAGTGYSVGVGFHLFRYMSAELNYRTVSMIYSETLGIGTSPPRDDYKSGQEKEIVMNLNFML